MIRPIGVGIVHEGRRSIPAGKMNPIIDVAFRFRQRCLKKTFGPEPDCFEAPLLLARENDADLLRVRSKDAHHEIIAHPMRPENSEGIGMRAGKKDIEFIDGHAGYFEGAHRRIVI